MIVKKAEFYHFRGIEEMAIDLHPRLTVIAGPNGIGKSTILDGLGIGLSWLSAKFQSSASKGKAILDSDRTNKTQFGSISLSVAGFDGMENLEWTVQKGKPEGRKVHGLQALNDATTSIRAKMEAPNEVHDLPLLAYYPVGRAVMDVSVRSRPFRPYRPLDALDGAFDLNTRFTSFFEWFRAREDFENENLRDNPKHQDHQLNAVRKAISIFIPEMKDMRVRRNPLRIEIIKEGMPMDLAQLSQGEKCLLALVGDISRRLSIANPGLADPLLGTGIILIDEIDLHLHPRWQREITGKLNATFPNLQFIVSTHSPLVLGEVSQDNVRVLSQNSEGKIGVHIPAFAKGLDSAEVLELVMDTNARDSETEEEFHKIYRCIDKADYSQAKKGISELKAKIGNVPEFVKVESLITMMEG